MKQLLVMSALGKDRPGVLHDITRTVRDCGCTVMETRMTVLGGEFALFMMVSGNWNTVTKLEDALPKLHKRLGLSVSFHRTEARETRQDLLPYAVDVVCLDQPGIVYNLANFFADRNIGIVDLSTRSYIAAHTGAPMFSVQMVISVPADAHIGTLREEFMGFCDELNLDAIMEPVKNG